MSGALAKREPAIELVRGLAQEVATLAPAQFGEARDFLKTLESAVERLRDMVEERTVQEIRQHGAKVTEKGTMQLTLGNWDCRAIPNKTGTDPKKLEARLRTKGVHPEDHMRAKITYEIDAEKLKALVERGIMTQEEVNSCAYDLTFRLDIKPAGNE